jgi:hypothetical protein
MTDSEHEAECVRRLGEEVGRIFHGLHNEYFNVRLKWQEFIAIFGSPGRVEIANDAAPAYFGMIQDVLWDDILMHICRMTDKPKMRLTFLALPKRMKDDSELESLVKDASAKTAFARDWRDRYLAHRDLNLALKRGHPLANATRRDTEAALDALHAILHHFGVKYFGNAGYSKDVVEAPGSAESLLFVLRDGVKYARQRFERDGFDEDDFRPLPPL